MTKVERSLRLTMNSWQFWIGVSYFVLVLVFVALFVQNARINTAQRRADQLTTIHIAETRASATSQYAQCVKSIPVLRRIDDFLIGVRELRSVILENSRETHRVTMPGTALYAAQMRNIARLEKSTLEIDFPIPTDATCAAARDKILARLGPTG